MILAISGSPRKNRMVHSTLQAVLDGCQSPYEIVSLAGKKIHGCIACLACAKDNTCKLRDDWNAIGEKMKQADIIIFGAPNYYGTINAMAHACLERTFSFRHSGTMPLKGKLGITVGTYREGVNSPEALHQSMGFFMKANAMQVIGSLDCVEYGPCYSCGLGHMCDNSSLRPKYGVLEKIEPCHLPKEVAQQEKTQQDIVALRKLLQEHGVIFTE